MAGCMVNSLTNPKKGNNKDLYSNYKELKKYEKKNVDYAIEHSKIKKRDFAIIAIHGGRIEYLTDIIAKDIAKEDFNYYAFKGTKSKNNSILHITATSFDEPIALKIISKSKEVISIHGCKSDEKIIQIGGLDKELVLLLIKRLKGAGFNCSSCKNDEISGNNPNNICNKGKLKKGVQIELSLSLRKEFEKNGRKTDLYKKFINVIRTTLKEYMSLK